MVPDMDNSKSDEVARLEKAAQKYYNRNMLQLALNECQKALALDSRSVSIRVLISKIAFSLEDNLAAEKEAKIALEIDPLSSEARNMLSVILIQKGQYKEAQAMLQAAIQETPNFWRLHWNLGLVYTYEKELQKARLAHWRAFVLNPSGTSLSGLVLAMARAYPTPSRILFMISFFLPIISQSPMSLLFTPVVVGYMWSTGYLESISKDTRRNYFSFIVGFLILVIHILAVFF